MSNNQYEYIGKILNDFNFMIYNEVDDDVICIICKKILINGCNGPCGCRYCWDCISNYLDGSMKYCPTNMDDCKIELLNIDTNIHIDNDINNKISKLIVKCPQTSCNYEDELIKMEEHLRVCNSRVVNLNTECKFEKVANDKLEEHLLLDNQVHVKLLMECIDVMRNEMDSLKKEMKSNEERNQLSYIQLNTKIEQQTREIANFNKDFVVLRNLDRRQQDELKLVQTREQETNAKLDKLNEEIIVLIIDMKQQINNMKIQEETKKTLEREANSKLDQLNEKIGALIRDNSDMKQQINNMKIQTEENKMDNLQIKKQTSEQNVQINQLKQDNKSIINNFSKNQRESENKQNEFSTRITTISPDKTSIIAKQYQLNQSIRNTERKSINLQNNNLVREINKGEFEWRIDNIFRKTNQLNIPKTKIYSGEFYSHKNGYKLCLYARIDKGMFDVGFYICRGEFDNILSWPFKHIVTISLINQQDNSIYSSTTIQYDNKLNKNYFNKPTDRSKSIYPTSHPHYLIEINELFSHESLCKNDEICIKFVAKLMVD